MAQRGVTVYEKMSDQLVRCHRDLFATEARLAETLAPQGLRIRRSIVDQWLVLEEHLRIYGSGLAPAGVLVLGGRPDEGSALTGIPFTGPLEARVHLGLTVSGSQISPSGPMFWKVVRDAQADAGDPPLESLFGTLALAHALPFDAPDAARQGLVHAATEHVEHLLDILRPQLVVAVGSDALEALGHAADAEGLVDLARADEGAWATHWPAGARMSSYPSAEVARARFRVVPCPAFDGPHAENAAATLAAVLNYVW